MQKPHLPYILEPQERHDSPSYISYEGVFTNIQCKKIVELGIAESLQSSTIGNGDVVDTIRNSKNSWICNQEDTRWIFDKISEVVKYANQSYMFDLTHFGERLQFTEYSQGQFYKWHVDNGAGLLSYRKLSVVVNLTNPLSYSGGELQIFSAIKEKIPKTQGSVIIFPSYKEHRVTPLIEGVRHSLVSWISGPPFK
jgi:PKHD-type hydroxylase